MHRLWVVLVAVLLLPGCGGRGVQTPYSGTWKILLLAPGEETALFIVEVTEKSDGPTARMVAVPQKVLQDAKVEAKKDDLGGLRLTVSKDDVEMSFVAYAPEGEARSNTLFGYAGQPAAQEFIRLERTEDDKIDRKKATTTHPAGDDFKKALRLKNLDERASALRPIVDDHPADVLGYFASLELLAAASSRAAAEANLRDLAEKAVAIATPYGPPMRKETLHVVARILVLTRKHPDLAVAYARRADEALGDSAPASAQVPVVGTLASALRLAGKDDETRAVKERLGRLEEELDREYRAKAVPFETQSVPRADGGNRAVLVELFTNAHCGPCPPAAIAFDALLKSRRGGDVALVQYHIQSAGPDPLANADVDQRTEYYKYPPTPLFYVDGREGPDAGGPRELAREVYGNLLRSLQKPLARPADAALTLAVTRSGDRIDIRADVTGLKKTGDDVRLRLALVEPHARYVGRNGQRLHSYVARGFAGGAAGLPIKSSAASPEVSLTVAELRKSLNAYLDAKGFAEDGRPLVLAPLKVVGFLQDDRTREVLQAAEADVPEAK